MPRSSRRFVSAFFAGATLVFGSLAPAVAPAQVYSTPTQAKYAAVVVDAATGEVLYARRADSPRYPASITKVMTLYLAFEAMAAGKLSPNDTIIISPRAAAQPPSKLGLRAGDTIRVDDAISALAVKSANDIAVALAEKIGGTEQKFATLMTLRAQELGMRNTRFVNASGLPDSRQLTSARDIAVLSRATMRDFPQYYGRFGQKAFTHRGSTMRNHNGLLHRMAGVDGIKTGYTNASGFNLAASAVRDGRRLIAVVLGGTSGASRDAHTADLLNAGFSVMARRQRGETITLASMFPERSTMVASVRGSVEQGDSEPVKPTRSEAVQLAQAVTPRVASRLRGVQETETAAEKPKRKRGERTPVRADEDAAPAKGKKVAKADDKPAKSGGWYVQVGAFPSEDDAADRVKTAAKKWSKYFGGAEGRVQKAAAGGHWRARFHGLDADQAKAACKALEAKKEPCLAVKS